MNSDGVIKGFNVFKYKPVGMVVVSNIEPVKPFSFNQGMERFNTGIVIRVTAMGIAALHLFRGFPPGIRNILAATVGMND